MFRPFHEDMFVPVSMLASHVSHGIILAFPDFLGFVQAAQRYVVLLPTAGASQVMNAFLVALHVTLGRKLIQPPAASQSIYMFWYVA